MRSALLAIAILVLAPSTLAAAPVATQGLHVEGKTTLGGTATALFALAGTTPTSWDASASSVVIETTSHAYTSVAHPIYPEGSLYTKYEPEQQTRASYGPAKLSSTAARDGGALLILAPSDSARVDGAGEGALAMQYARDPTLDQGAPNAANAGTTGPSSFKIHERVRGEYANVTLASGELTLTGDLTLRLYDVDYALAAANGTESHQTGKTQDQAPVRQGRDAIDTITLHDAILHVRASTPVTLLSQHPAVAMSGTLTLDHATGPLDIAGLTRDATGAYEGRAALDITAQNGALALAPPTSLSSASASHFRATATPPLIAVIAVGIALLAIGALGYTLLRPRRAGATGDDLELALLAMEERRWNDALPHLERLVAANPSDATILADRAICLEETGRWQEARAGYEAALANEPQNGELHYYYARVLARLRLTTAAMAHLTRALALDERLAELARREQAFAAFADHPSFVGLVGRTFS